MKLTELRAQLEAPRLKTILDHRPAPQLPGGLDVNDIMALMQRESDPQRMLKLSVLLKGLLDD